MTLRSILRTLPPGSEVSGSIRFDGEEVLDFSPKRLREFRANDVALIAQNPHGALNPVLRIEEFLLEGEVDVRKAGRSESRTRVMGILDEVGIHDVERVMRSYPHQLSGGMLQRVVIASAIAASPKLLLADEPTTALDVTTQAEVVAILDEMRRERGMSMIFVTHDLDLAAAMCDRLIVMYQGQIQEVGKSKAITETPRTDYTRRLIASRPRHLDAFKGGSNAASS